MNTPDFTLQTQSGFSARLLEASADEISIEPNSTLFSLGFGRSSAGHGCPMFPAKHLLEVDEFLYLRAHGVVDAVYEPVSSTYEMYRHFRQMNYVPKPGLQFGCAFLLYTAPVDVVHADFMVVTERRHLLNALEIARRMKKRVVWAHRSCENTIETLELAPI